MNKFLIGLILGIVIAGGLAVYLNNTPMPFINKTVVKSVGLTASQGDAVLTGDAARAASAPKNANASDTGYDFYEILQTKQVKKPAASSANAVNTANAANDSLETPADNRAYMLQAGAFRTRTAASDMRARLALLGIDSSIKSVQQKETIVYKVLIGPFKSTDNAQKIINRLSDQHINAVLIKIPN